MKLRCLLACALASVSLAAPVWPVTGFTSPASCSGSAFRNYAWSKINAAGTKWLDESTVHPANAVLGAGVVYSGVVPLVFLEAEPPTLSSRLQGLDLNLNPVVSGLRHHRCTQFSAPLYATGHA